MVNYIKFGGNSMASGSYSGSFDGQWGKYATPVLYYSYTQDIAGNFSTVKLTFKVKRNSSSTSSHDSSAKYWIKCNGDSTGTITKNFDITTVGVGSYVTIGTKTTKVTHDSDGTKSINVSCALSTGTTLGRGSVSNTLKLASIARASTPTIGNATMGNSVTVSVDRKSTSFQYVLTYSFGGTSGNIGTISAGSGTSISWLIPKTLANQIPSGLSGTVTVTCKTYNGSTLIGTNTGTSTLSIPIDSTPKLSFAVSDPTGIAAKFGYYLVGKSQIHVAATETLMYGAGVKSRTTTANGATYTSKNPTTSFITSTSNTSVSGSFVDTRNKTATAASLTLSIRAYSAPKITTFNTVRSSDKKSITVNWAFTYDYFKNGTYTANTATIVVGYKLKTDSDYSNTKYEYSSASNLSGSKIYSGLDPTKSYDVKLVLTDTVGSADGNLQSLSNGDHTMSFKADGKGVAIGKGSEQPGLEVDWDSQFNKAVSIQGIDMALDQATINMWTQLFGGGMNLKNLLLNISHPVGSIIQTTKPESAFNPNTMLGGTWKLLQGIFLFGADASRTLGTSGGSADAVIVSHNHIQNAHSHTPTQMDYFLAYTGTRSSETVGSIAGTGWVMPQLATGGTWQGNSTSSVKATNVAAGVSGAGKNMPPYKAVNIWERTA